MTRYHINPQTGNPNVCNAKVKCRLTSEDGIEPPHYDSKDEAKQAVDAQIAIESHDASETQETAEASKDVEIAETVPEVQELEKATHVGEVITVSDEELRGPDSLEKVIKIARKTANKISVKKHDALESFKELKKKAPKLSTLRSRIKKS